MSNFWKDFSFPSPIDDLLPNPECTLESLLDVDDVIRDTRSHKQVLVDLYVASLRSVFVGACTLSEETIAMHWKCVIDTLLA